MKMLLVPGYKELFGDNGKTYDEWLQGIPSELVINLLTALNNELNTTEEGEQRQQRLRKIVSQRFTEDQLKFLDFAYWKFKKRNNDYQGYVFGRRYILDMLTKEFNRNEQQGDLNVSPEQEFQIMMAYLQVVEEINQKDEKNNKEIVEKSASDNYYLVWPFLIDQYEFNHDPSAAFETLKLLCYSKYCFENLRPFLKEYLSANGFSNLGQFLASFNQVVATTFISDEKKLFRKLNYISPLPNIDVTHLIAQSINIKIESGNVSLSDIRKFPLYQKPEDKSFLIIDESSYRKKIYRGPFFEIYYNTSLSTTKTFNQHSQDISKGTMEEMCFRAICFILRKTKYETLHFDDNKESQPDAFYRNNKKVIMVEFKDYVFKESLLEGKNFEEIKQYIDEKFVKSGKKNKGIGQLAQQIDLLSKGKYSFDSELNNIIAEGKTITIYPVLCYSDFMFSMPGINRYINDLFQELIKGHSNKLIIKPVTLINIEILFDYSRCYGSFPTLIDLIDRYWILIRNRTKKFEREASIDNYLESLAGFDEIYNSLFMKDFFKRQTPTIVKSLQNFIGINQELIDEEL